MTEVSPEPNSSRIARPFAGLLRRMWRSKQAVLTAGIRIFSALASLAFSIVGARLLGADEFGGYVSLMTAASLGAVVLSFGLPQLMEREIAYARGSSDSTRLVPVVQFVFAALLFLSLSTVAVVSLWGVTLGLAMAFMTLSAAAGMLGAVHSGMERVLFNAWTVNVWRPIAALVSLCLLGVFEVASPLSAFAAQTFGVLLSIALFGYVLHRRDAPKLAKLSRDVRSGSSWTSVHSKVVVAALTFAAVQVVINATTQIDIIALTIFTDPATVGHYYAAARAANVVSFFYGASLALASPKIVRLVAAGDRSGAQGAVREAASTGSFLTVAAAMLGMLLSGLYLGFYGASFLQAQDALLILLVGFGVMSLFGPAQPVLLAYGKEKIVFAITVAALLINAAVSFFLIPIMGMTGAAVSTSVQMICYIGGQAAACHFLCGVRTDVFQRRRALQN